MDHQFHVLIADDHAVYRRLLTAVFESFGCIVTSVTDGAEALVTPGQFDLICLDRHMGSVSGDEVAAKIGSAAFLMACTSDPLGAPADFNVLVTKPFSCADIYAAIESARIWRAANGASTWHGSARPSLAA